MHLGLLLLFVLFWQFGSLFLLCILLVLFAVNKLLFSLSNVMSGLLQKLASFYWIDFVLNFLVSWERGDFRLNKAESRLDGGFALDFPDFLQILKKRLINELALHFGQIHRDVNIGQNRLKKLDCFDYLENRWTSADHLDRLVSFIVEFIGYSESQFSHLCLRVYLHDISADFQWLYRHYFVVVFCA